MGSGGGSLREGIGNGCEFFELRIGGEFALHPTRQYFAAVESQRE